MLLYFLALFADTPCFSAAAGSLFVEKPNKVQMHKLY